MRCGAGTLPVGAEVVIRARARVLVAGILKSVIVATSRTPDLNTTNNVALNGVVVSRPAAVRVAVRAPALGRVGEPVSDRVVATGSGASGADFVRVCHRPPATLLVTSAPGTFTSRGRVCRDVRRLRRAQRAAFDVYAIPAARAGGRTFRLAAAATAPGLRRATGSDHIAIVAQSLDGTGRG